MKIAFLIQDLFQQGAQYVTALMIRGFAAKGYEVDLIVSKVHKDLLCQGDIKPFEVPSSTNTIILPDRNAKNNVRAIRNYLIDNTPDAIVAMSTNYNFALALASLYLPRRIKKKCRIAYVEHSGLVGLDKSGKQSKSPRLLSKARIISFVFNHVYDVIMGVSEGTSHGVETTMHRKHGSVLTVYNPAIDELYWKKLKSPTTNNWLKDKTIPTLVAAGAHSPIKNHLCLFEAIKLANQKTPVRLVLFGKGNLTNSYKLWIKENGMADRIMLAGHTSNLPAELKKADAFIVSSNMESFSIVLVEAMAAGTPVISTECPYGPPEILQNGKYGVLVPINNPQALADAIVSQVKNPKVAAPRESWEPYTLENVVKAYEDALGLSSVND